MIKYYQNMEVNKVDDELNPDELPASSEEEQKNNISSDLIRGHINTIILRTLYERDKYGYEIIEEIEQKSHGQYTLKQPTLYSALKRLESQGYINAYWKTDEVSLGGRRKYYTLTDSGREIAERNQAEWEYSRTVIDNLISDRNFDFSQPAPNPVDFKILKKYTSRVPLVKDSEDEDGEKEQQEQADKPAEAPVTEQSPVQPQPVAEPVPAQPIAAPAAEQAPLQSAPIQVEQPVQPTPAQPAAEQQPAPVAEQPVPPEPQMSDEQRRIQHENYLKLISQPVVEKQETPPAPYAESIDTNKLIYNNKPEAERDYRNLVNNLYLRTVRSQPAQPVQQPAPVYVERREPAQPVNRYEDAHARAEKDGLKVNTDYSVQNARRKKYNRGATLFKCSLIVAAIMLLEFALCLVFQKDLGVGIGYPMVILALTVAQVLIFGILFYNDRGKTTRKPSTLTYLSASFILTVITILIICVVSLLLSVNFASAGDVCAKIVIPCFIALNIPVFSILFYAFSK